MSDARGTFLTILAPGQGENKRPALDASLTSQLQMFDGIVDALPTLTEDQLPQFFKDAAFRTEPLAGPSISPRPGVTIDWDEHRVPRVRGVTRQDAMFGVGYARGSHRLWQMDVFRHAARSRLSALVGPGDHGEVLARDAGTFAFLDYSDDELQAMFDGLARHGRWGDQARVDVQAYVDGINGFIEHAAEGGTLPDQYAQVTGAPRPWTVVDEIAVVCFHSIVPWTGGRGHANAVLLRRLQAGLGKERGAALYGELRARDDVESPVIFGGLHEAQPDPGWSAAGVALIDPGSLEPRSPVAREDSAAGPSSELVSDAIDLLWGRPRGPRKSNALLIAGRHSARGNPMMIAGPQDGFCAPHPLDLEIEIHAPDVMVRGILEVAGPYPYNGGRTSAFAYSPTMQGGPTPSISSPSGWAPTGSTAAIGTAGEMSLLSGGPTSVW